MQKLKIFLLNNIISGLLILVGVLMIWCCFLIIKNKKIIEETIQIKETAEEIKFQLDAHLDVVRELDVSLRGFAITKEERYLYIKPNELKAKMHRTFNRMDSLLKVQNYNDSEGMKVLRKYQSAITVLIDDQAEMVKHIRNDNYDGFLEIFNLDKGNNLGPFIEATDKLINGHQNQLALEAEQKYQNAMQNNIVIQIIMVLIGIPSIILILIKVKNDNSARKQLFKELDNTNKKYLFHPGNNLHYVSKAVIKESIINLQKASEFISKISEGELKVDWEGLNDENKSLNEKSLAGKLVVMREKMAKVKQEDDERNWINEGLSKLGDILRGNQDLQKVTDDLLTNLIHYIDANQGVLFLVEEDKETKEEYLELNSAYAFDRKKFINKKILPGETLAGQAWIEKKKIILKEIPEDYVRIKSGLGDSSPNYIIIIPLKFDERVIGILELASFNEFPAYKILFLERLAESMASTFMTLKMNNQTIILLEQAQQQTEEMQAQEEEMRQNMEELEATQEEMRRKEQQFIDEIERLKNSEKKHNKE